MAYNTGNPIGSTDVRDLLDNSQNLDYAVNSSENTFVDRLGVQRLTMNGMSDAAGDATIAINAAAESLASSYAAALSETNAGTSETNAAAYSASSALSADTASTARDDSVIAKNESIAARNESVALSVGFSSGVAGYATQALLYADLVPANGSVAYVTNDTTPANNGTYRKNGATGAGSWVQSSFDRVALAEASILSNSITASNNSFMPGGFTANEGICIKCIEHIEVKRFTGFTDPLALLKLTTDGAGKPTEINFFTDPRQYIITSKVSEDLINGFETWASEIDNAICVTVLVNVKLTPILFSYVDNNFATNNMKVQQYVDVPERLSVLYNGLYHQYVEFTKVGVYRADGIVTLSYGGYHKALAITKPGFYQIGWTLGGAVRYMHAVNATGEILASWNGEYFNEVRDTTIDVPVGTTELRLSAYSSSPYNESNPKDGFLIHTAKADGAIYGVVSEDRINALIADSDTDDVPYIEIFGNMWTDGLWRNPTATDTVARVYPISSAETYELLFAPSLTVIPEQTISSISITKQLASMKSFAPMVHNSLSFNNLGNDCDSFTVNGYTRQGYVSAAWTPPAGAKSLIVQVASPYGAGKGIRIYKRKGAKGLYAKNNNANKRIAVCGDSVAANPRAELGKERLRDTLGCVVDTYAVPGAGFPINATPGWVTTNNVSGVMQVEELVKVGSPLYDIYCLSGTLNDPVTHNKAIGIITHCKPYLKVNGLPDFTDPNLDTMLGAFNFCIQRIYEKNPKAKIVISTMGKMFLSTPTSGFDTAAGYDINSISTNTTGSTYYQYVQALRLLGESWGIPVVEIYGKAGINEFNKAATMKDAYHPTFRGYESIWNLWFDAVIGS